MDCEDILTEELQDILMEKDEDILTEELQEIWSRSPDLVRVQYQSCKPFGWGWVVAEDGEDVFLLTSNTVHFLLKKRWLNDSPTERVLFLQSAPEYFTRCCATVREDEFSVISSDEDRIFNYAVLRLKLSRYSNVRFSFRLNPVTKPAPSPGDRLTFLTKAAFYDADVQATYAVCLEKPKDLLRWLRESNVKYPLAKCEPEMNWDIVEHLHDILIPLFCLFSPDDGPFILKENNSKSMEVIGMVNPSANVNLYFRDIGFAVHIEKIIEDIHKKQPNLARKLFSSYFE